MRTVRCAEAGVRAGGVRAGGVCAGGVPHARARVVCAREVTRVAVRVPHASYMCEFARESVRCI